MPGQLHKVGRQIIDAEMISSEDDGLALQKRLSVFWRDRLLPALEQALDRCAVPDLTVRIEDRDEADVVMDGRTPWLRGPRGLPFGFRAAPRPAADAAGRANSQPEPDQLLQAALHLHQVG